MAEGPADPERGVDLRRTVEQLEQTSEIDGEKLRSTYREFREGNGAEDRAEFLEYLLEENVIDEETYVSASENEPVEVQPAEFEELPPRGDHYELHGLIDEGGMGKIRVGEDPHLERSVAVKILRAGKAGSELERRRFLREAQVTAKLAHPNIVPVHTLHSEGDERASFAMKLVDGETLFDVVWEARDRVDAGEELDDELEFRRRLDLFLRICDALAYAHDRGVIHRDLKPSNIMVGRYNEVYVMDWGIAKILDQPSEEERTLWETQWEEIDADDEVQTRAGSLVGTPPYMPPEQARGEHDELDARSDLYSLGAILFEMVTLERMVPGEKVHEVLQNVQTGERASFETYAPGESVERELRAIIGKATALEPEDRYESVDALADDVRNYLDNREVSAHPDGPIRKITRLMSHHRDIALAIVFGVFVIVASAFTWSLWKQKRAVEHSRHRESQVSRLQAEISSRSHRIDRQFLRFELLVRRLAVSARDLLRGETDYRGPVYSAADFESPKSAPPDLRKSPVYGKRVSVETPVFTTAPGVDREVGVEAARKLMPLRGRFRSMFVDSQLASDVAADPTGDYWERVAVDGVPGRWAFVGLESGVHFSYPGKGGYPDEFDPRERPWYRAGKQVGRVGWAAPYPDAQDQGLVLPCVAPIRKRGGELLGVAGFEVTLDFVRERFMQTKGPVDSTYVLDSGGEVLVKTEGKRLFDGKGGDGVKPRILQMVRDDESGVFTDRGGPTEVYALYRMPTLDWFYVARAPLPAVLDWGSEG